MAVSIFRITPEGYVRITEAGDIRVIQEVIGGATFVPNPQSGGDISTVWQVDLSRGDFQMAGPVLQAGDDLDTALLLSLFSDRLADADDVIPDGSDDRRGWWGDTGEIYKLGSRLWLLYRAKLTAAVGPQCENYINEALQWFLDDGVAAKIDVSATVILPSALVAQIEVFRQDGSRVAANFAWVWQRVS